MVNAQMLMSRDVIKYSYIPGMDRFLKKKKIILYQNEIKNKDQLLIYTQVILKQYLNELLS